MELRPFGKTGFNVFPLGFGTMNLPRVPLEQSRAALNYALDHGINYIDTAPTYRNSEEIVGECISHRRDEFFLATKVRNREYKAAKEEIENSLRRLKTDHIDLLQIHYVNYEKEYEELMGENGSYRAALEAKEEGKVRFIGISGHRPELLARWLESGKFEQVLFHLSLVQPFALEDLIPTATRLGIAKTAMKPLSGGFVRPVDKAIRFPLSQQIDVLISGMTSVEEVKMNLAALESEISEEEGAELLRLAEELGAHNCRRCNYCSCPIEIKIPDVMISSVVTPKLGLLPRGEQFFKDNREKLLACADYDPCKEEPQCEKLCPYHLPMQRVIQETAAGLR
jgi:aryl-alcohol dehydrogenase-like predicted oxidoreductase